ASVYFRRQAMLYGVLDQRLQQHARNHGVERRSLELLHDTQLVATEADDFNIEIVVDKFQLLAQGDEGVRAAEQAAQDIGQFDNQLTGSVGIEANQRRD